MNELVFALYQQFELLFFWRVKRSPAPPAIPVWCFTSWSMNPWYIGSRALVGSNIPHGSISTTTHRYRGGHGFEIRFSLSGQKNNSLFTCTVHWEDQLIYPTCLPQFSNMYLIYYVDFRPGTYLFNLSIGLSINVTRASSDLWQVLLGVSFLVQSSLNWNKRPLKECICTCITFVWIVTLNIDLQKHSCVIFIVFRTNE